MFGKAEFQNPGGSVKDRAALGLVEAAERTGQYVVIFLSTTVNTNSIIDSSPEELLSKGQLVILGLGSHMCAERKVTNV